MKNKKFKLFASLTSLVMVVAVMAVGVWAATTTASAKITGTANFTAVTGIQGSIVATSLTNGATLAGETSNVSVLSVALNSETANVTDVEKALTFAFVDGDSDGYIGSAQDKTSFEVTYKITNVGPVAFKFSVNIVAPTASSAGVQMAAAVTAIDGELENAAANVEVTAAPSAGQSVEHTVTITYSLTGTHNGSAISLSTTDNSMALVTISLTV